MLCLQYLWTNLKAYQRVLTIDKQHVVRVNNREVHTSEQKSFV